MDLPEEKLLLSCVRCVNTGAGQRVLQHRTGQQKRRPTETEDGQCLSAASYWTLPTPCKHQIQCPYNDIY